MPLLFIDHEVNRFKKEPFISTIFVHFKGEGWLTVRNLGSSPQRRKKHKSLTKLKHHPEKHKPMLHITGGASII